MKNLFPITFFVVLTLYIILTLLSIDNRQLFTTMSLIPILSLWFFSTCENSKSIKFWMTLAFTTMFIGFSTGQLVVRGQDYIAKSTLFEIAELLFLTPVIFNLGLNPEKKLKLEVFKFGFVAVLGLLFILLFFELFSFFEQTVVFFRILQLGLFFGWTWKNPKISFEVNLSLFILVFSYIVFILSYSNFVHISEELFVNPLFFISKYYLVSGLIKSFQKKQLNISQNIS